MRFNPSRSFCPVAVCNTWLSIESDPFGPGLIIISLYVKESKPVSSADTGAIALQRVGGGIARSRGGCASGQLAGCGSTNPLPGQPGRGQQPRHDSPLGIAQQGLLQHAATTNPV